MKILTKSRVFAVAHIPLATAALLGICAADELRGERTVATSAVPATSDASANGPHCAAPQASTSAVLVGPDGHAGIGGDPQLIALRTAQLRRSRIILRPRLTGLRRIEE